jgi:chromosome segregation ATPase
MSIADVLFGITMQTQGVSKKISVRFDEYEEPAAA